MGVTVEFYSAEPHTLVTLFATEVDGEESDERFFEQVKTCPTPIFRDVLAEQIWDDEPSVTESLTTLADAFAESLAELSEQAVEDVARAWAATFPYQERLLICETTCRRSPSFFSEEMDYA